MTSEVDICNRALGQSGARDSIMSLSDKSEAARQCARFYQPTRDGILRAAHWDFARAAAYLTVIKALPGTPENPDAPISPLWNPSYPQPPWVYSCAYPSDCLAVRYVSPQFLTGGTAIPTQLMPTVPFISYGFNGLNIRPVHFAVATDFDIAGNQATVVLTNQPNAIGIYTRKITNPDLWDSLFEEAMVDSLAARLVFPLSGDKSLRAELIKTARMSVLTAQVRDGNEGLTIDESLPEWIRVRGWSNGRNEGYVGQCSMPGWLY